jgi:antitoxin YefM
MRRPEIGSNMPLDGVLLVAVGVLQREDGERAYMRQRVIPGCLDSEPLVILMTMSSTMPLAEVKAHLSELVSRVSAEHDRVTVTVHGRPSAMLLAVEDVEALEETIAILSDTETMKQLFEAGAEIARGEGETQEQLAEAMHRRRNSRD